MKTSFTELVVKFSNLKELPLQDAESYLLVAIETYINKHTKSNNSDLHKEVNRLSSVLEQQNTERETLLVHIDRNKNKINDLKAELSSLEIENTRLQEEYKASKAKRDTLKKSNDSLNLKIRSENYKINNDIKFGGFHIILFIMYPLKKSWRLFAVLYHQVG